MELNTTKPVVGQRVAITESCERFDSGIIEPGATGTITLVEPENAIILVKLDETVEWLNEWDNCLSFSEVDAIDVSDHLPDLKDRVTAGFWHYVRIVEDATED